MRRSVSAFGAVLAVLSVACWPPAFALDAPSATQVTYPLDDVSRWLGEEEALPCETEELELVQYRGEHVRLSRPVRIHPAFQPHVSAFEELVVNVAESHFGRAPRRLVHLGAFVCRAMRGRDHLISEHALGNALDVAGFEFGPLPRGKSLPPKLPRAMRGAFTVSVKSDWNAVGKRAPHSEFLRALVAELIERPDVVRSLVGPGWPGHDNHFHLAMPPYRLVKIEDTVRWGW